MGPQSIVPPQPRIPALLLIALCLLLLPPQSPAQSTVAATTIPLILPSAIVFDPQGNLYFAETANHVIRKVDTTGIITTIAGTGTQGFSGDAGPPPPPTRPSPPAPPLPPTHNPTHAPPPTPPPQKPPPAPGKIPPMAGPPATGYNGDNPTATTATLALPHGLTIDPAGNLYLADTQNHRIRRIDATTDIITTVAGQGTQTYAGAAGPATAASLDTPRHTTVPPTGLV